MARQASQPSRWRIGAGRARRTFVSLLFAFSITGPAAATDGLEPIGISLPAVIRGGADVAVGDSALSQIDNPATLSLSSRHGPSLDFTGQLLIQRARWSNRLDDAHSTFRHVPLGHVGLALPQSDRWTWGLAFQSKSQIGSHYRLRHLMMPTAKRRVGADMRNLALSMNAAYKLTDKLSLGAGLRGGVATAEFNVVTGPIALEFGRGYAFGAGFQIGLHYQALPTLALGLAYRSPTWFQDLTGETGRGGMTGAASGSLFGLRPFDLGEGRIEDIRLPQRLAAGWAWDAAPWLKLVGEVRWINYDASVFNVAHFGFDNPANLNFKAPVGYHDQWALMAGAELELDAHWTLGLGYHYATNPTPRAAVLPIAANIVQHHLTAGLRYQADGWWVGGGYVLGIRNTLDAARISTIPFGYDYAVTSLEQTQHSLLFGFGLTW